MQPEWLQQLIFLSIMLNLCHDGCLHSSISRIATSSYKKIDIRWNWIELWGHHVFNLQSARLCFPKSRVSSTVAVNIKHANSCHLVCGLGCSSCARSLAFPEPCWPLPASSWRKAPLLPISSGNDKYSVIVTYGRSLEEKDNQLVWGLLETT